MTYRMQSIIDAESSFFLYHDDQTLTLHVENYINFSK